MRHTSLSPKSKINCRTLLALGLLGSVCLVCVFLFDTQKGGLFSSFSPYIALAVTIMGVISFGLPNLRKSLIIVLVGAIAVLCGLVAEVSANPVFALLLVGLIALVALTVALWVTKQLTTKRLALLLMAGGFLLRLCYILYTPVNVRQHDVWNFSDGSFTDFDNQRHAEYIEYIAAYLKLPEVDPTQVGLSQLYHPPLHHFIAGVWLRLNTLLGFSYETACENIQYLTLFYSSACMVLSYKIFKLLQCKGISLILPTAIVCFHPTFVLMAGSVNNDILCIALSFYAIYAAIRWYQKPSFLRILAVAIGVGGAMMAKLSGGLVAPAIALLFLWKWLTAIKAKNKTALPLFWQFCLFGVICVPLGLWWPIKNAITYQMPLTYVPALTENSGQYLGDYSFFERLFAMPAESFKRIFMAWDNDAYGSSYNEYNLFIALFKTSVFGEFTLFGSWQQTGTAHTAGTVFAQILFYANLFLIGLSTIAGGLCIFRKKYRFSSPLTLFFLVLWGVLLLSYLRFCFTFPQACTQNFRYAVPTLLCGCCFLGQVARFNHKWFNRLLTAGTVIFVIACVGCYALLALV